MKSTHAQTCTNEVQTIGTIFDLLTLFENCMSSASHIPSRFQKGAQTCTNDWHYFQPPLSHEWNLHVRSSAQGFLKRGMGEGVVHKWSTTMDTTFSSNLQPLFGIDSQLFSLPSPIFENKTKIEIYYFSHSRCSYVFISLDSPGKLAVIIAVQQQDCNQRFFSGECL